MPSIRAMPSGSVPVCGRAKKGTAEPRGPRCPRSTAPDEFARAVRRALPAMLLLLLIAPDEAGVGPHLDLARLRLRLLRQRDAQHALAALRGNVPHLYR